MSEQFKPCAIAGACWPQGGVFGSWPGAEIVRHRVTIEAVINNARQAIDLVAL
jgi:hypothetical protein